MDPIRLMNYSSSASAAAAPSLSSSSSSSSSSSLLLSGSSSSSSSSLPSSSLSSSSSASSASASMINNDFNNIYYYYNETQLEALPYYPWQIIIIIIYSTTAFISLSSNILTIIILLRNEQVSSELWKFLFNLSISDITMALFCIPFTYTNYMLGHWIFSKYLCPIIPFFQILAVSVSIWTLTLIGIDRFFAIIYPFRSLLWLKRYKITTISIIWLFGSLIASPQLFYTRTQSFEYRGQLYDDCREQFSSNGVKLYTIFIFLFTFFLPIIILIYVYSKICIHLLNNKSIPGNPNQIRDKYCVNKKIKVIKMLLTIVILFAVCWFPLHLFQLLYYFYPNIQNLKTKFSYYLYVGSFFICHWLAMAHSFVNPFVYCFMSGNFRWYIFSSRSSSPFQSKMPPTQIRTRTRSTTPKTTSIRMARNASPSPSSPSTPLLPPSPPTTLPSLTTSSATMGHCSSSSTSSNRSEEIRTNALPPVNDLPQTKKFHMKK